MPANSADNSAILALPYIQPSQAQKHVTHNDAIATLDVLVQLSVVGFDATTPPVNPAEGETHALGTGATGVWAGQDNKLATWRDGAWVFIAPLAGWRAWGASEGELRIWDGTIWGLPLAEMDNLAGIGVNTTSDATNRLSVSASATLLSHDGSDHQLKINKSGATDTASLLFQSGWTGHAEMGLSGGTDFSIKVSDDGTGWTEALHINGVNGKIGIGVANPKERLHVAGNVRFGNSDIIKWDDAAGVVKAVLRVDAADIFTIRGAGGPRALEVEDSSGGIIFTVMETGNTGVGVPAPTVKFAVREPNNSMSAIIENTNASLSSRVLDVRAIRAASSAFDLARFHSGGVSDVEFRFSGDGNGTCDGSWTGGGADYAEYFEWEDGNPMGEDRRGISVVLVGDQIREAVAGEDPIGVISGNPSVVGDAAALRWKGKYLRDDFGSVVTEDYEAVSWSETVTEPDDAGKITTRQLDHSYAADGVPDGITVPDDATHVTQSRRKLSPGYDPAHGYTPRAERAEWDTVGLMGKLRLRKGQVSGAGWVKMRDVNGVIEEWLVR